MTRTSLNLSGSDPELKILKQAEDALIRFVQHLGHLDFFFSMSIMAIYTEVLGPGTPNIVIKIMVWVLSVLGIAYRGDQKWVEATGTRK